MTVAETSSSAQRQDEARRTAAVVLDAAAPDVAPVPGSLEDAVAELVLLRFENEQLREALTSNREIGAASGILMAQHSLTQDQAFDRLRQRSQHSHRKLRDVASDVLFTGTLAPVPAGHVSNSDGSRQG